MPWDGPHHAESHLSYFIFFFAYIITRHYFALLPSLYTAHSITGILDIILDIILNLEFHGDEDVAIWDVGVWSGGRHHSRWSRDLVDIPVASHMLGVQLAIPSQSPPSARETLGMSPSW